MNTIRNYRNSVRLNFEERGDNFTLKVPHRGKWIAIVRFLKGRGFEITENPSYKEHYSCLSKFHKLGFKKNVACLMEISSGFIEVEFGNTKNLWKGIAQSFWSSKSDDRYTHLNYLEEVSVRLEIFKLLEFCKKYGHSLIKEDSVLNPEQYIIQKNKNNPHIHGHVDSLEDIKKSISESSYDYTSNSNDKNRKKIVCGETKYFYDYWTKRLMKGEVWHNINNMWWVITENKLRNIASWELFDFNNSLSRKKEITEKELTSLLSKFESKREYSRCEKILNYHKKSTSSVFA